MLRGLSSAWLPLVNNEQLSKVVANIEAVTPDSKICPSKDLWFEWARLTPLEEVKVVIIGQSPLPSRDARGLAFSTSGKFVPAPLRNIYAAMHKCSILSAIPAHGDLTAWARAGVLLLNAALSTEEKKSVAHKALWKDYTAQLVRNISAYGIQNGAQYTFLLWGKGAQTMRTCIDSDHHRVLEWLHPSPMVQAAAPAEKRFINCDHFAQCAVDWSLPDTAAGGTVVSDVMTLPEEKINADCTSINSSPRFVQAFTDGSCINNGKANATGGFAVVFAGGPIKGKTVYGKMVSRPNDVAPVSNIRAEGRAIIEAMRRVQKIDPSTWDAFCIYSDSKFWISMITQYMPNWSVAKFETMKNPDMTTKIWELWNAFPTDKKISMAFVPAHNRKGWKDSPDPYKRWCYKYNNKADILAGKAYAQL